MQLTPCRLTESDRQSVIELPPISILPASALLQSTATEWGSSRYGELQRCGEAYHLRYHLKIHPSSRPSYFGVGSLVHAGIRAVEQQEALELGSATPDTWKA